MQALNYLREAVPDMERHFIPIMQGHGFFNDVAACRCVCKAAQAAPKFVAPVGGRIFNDRLKGLPEEVRLPYPEIVIEYRGSDGVDGAVENVFGDQPLAKATKRIVYAREVADGIEVYSFCYMIMPGETSGYWAMQPYYVLSYQTDADDPNVGSVPESEKLPGMSEMPGTAVKHFPTGSYAEKVIGPTWRKNAYFDLMDEMIAVYELIEALSCSNVSHEPLPSPKMNKSAAKRGALPFDSYRVLVINSALGPGSGVAHGSHRSPREHLRRGHIRRLQDGRRIWINSTVVCAGVGSEVRKDYVVRAA